MRKLRFNSPRLWAWTVFLLSTFYCLWYGRIGLSSLDSSIVFEGAWRLVQGETIARDFFVPNGLVPMAIQALFFKVFGVSWFSYCLHAALFNGLFALIVFHWLRKFQASLPLATTYALLSGMVFYPPFGTPFMDQHAFFFVLLLLFFTQQAPQMNGGKQKLVYLSLVPIFMLAFYSKQVPSIFALSILPLIWGFATHKGKWFRNLGFLFPSLLLGGLIWSIVFHPWDLDWQSWFHHQWEMPMQTGMSRITGQQLYLPWRVFTSLIFIPRTVFGPFVWPLVALIYALPAVLMLWQVMLGGKNRWQGLSLLVLAWLMMFVTGWYVRVTLNQEANGLALLFLALGFVHLFLRGWWLRHSDRISTPFLRFQLPAIILWWSVLGGSTWTFHKNVVVERSVHDFKPGEAPKANWPKGIRGLDFMTYGVTGPSGDLNPGELLAFLNGGSENFFFLGDQSFFYGLTERQTPLPVVWLHPQLTYSMNPEGYETLDLKLLANLQTANPKYLIGVDPSFSMAKGDPTFWERTLSWLNSRIQRSYSIGGYYVAELKTN